MKDTTKEFETERLVLRKFRLEDADQIFNNYAKNDNVTKYLRWNSHKTVEDSKSFLTGFVLPAYESDDTYRWAIVLKETGEVIGSIDTVSVDMKLKKAELGWVIGEEFWGRGIMPEAARVVVSYLFEQGFVRIEAFHNVENPKSGRVMQKIGMVFEGTLHKAHLDKDGNLIDVNLYAIVR